MTATLQVTRSSHLTDAARTYQFLLDGEMSAEIPITSSGSRRSTLEGIVCTPTISTPRAPKTSAHNCLSVEARGTV